MSNNPKYVGRIFRPYDWYGWLMSIFGLTLIYFWIKTEEVFLHEKFLAISSISYITVKYFWRVCFGAVYKIVYYDTIVHHMYEIDIDGGTYYICAENEDELDLYLEAHYPLVSENYKIISKSEVESFIKREHYE